MGEEGVDGRAVVEGEDGVEVPEAGLGLVREHGEFAAEHSVNVGHGGGEEEGSRIVNSGAYKWAGECIVAQSGWLV